MSTWPLKSGLPESTAHVTRYAVGTTSSGRRSAGGVGSAGGMTADFAGPVDLPGGVTCVPFAAGFALPQAVMMMSPATRQRCICGAYVMRATPATPRGGVVQRARGAGAAAARRAAHPPAHLGARVRERARVRRGRGRHDRARAHAARDARVAAIAA